MNYYQIVTLDKIIFFCRFNLSLNVVVYSHRDGHCDGDIMATQHSLSALADHSFDVALDSQVIFRLGQAAASRRKELGLSCSSVARSIGVTKKKLAAFESGFIGADSVRIKFVFRLAEALNMGARDIFLALDD